MRIALGHSSNPNTEKAIEDLIASCQRELGRHPPDLGIFFTSRMETDFHAALERILGQWPDLQLVGCSTDGEISDIIPVSEDTLTLVLIQSDHICFGTGWGEDVSKDPEAAVRQAVDSAHAALNASANRKGTDDQPVFGIVLAEGLKIFGIDLDRSLCEALGEEFPIVGGYAGDHFLLEYSCQFNGNRVLSDGLVIILASGPVQYSMGIGNGRRPVGNSFAVTSHEGNVVREIDGMPILDFYDHYLGANQEEYLQFPLAVMMDDQFILRAPAFINHENASIAFCGTFPPAPRVRLTEFDHGSIIQAAERTTISALERYPGPAPDLALLFSCTSRRHILGLNTAQEHSALLQFKANHPAFRFCGMYAYGELCPKQGQGPTLFHNDSYVVLLLGEDA
ncbi:MAG: hypothetical protein EA399_16490 [Desulfovibrionales bacterium]|nr:MAG: hypothetical protein EA399_16490 [Desulfovibrionales bacterium]